MGHKAKSVAQREDKADSADGFFVGGRGGYSQPGGGKCSGAMNQVDLFADAVGRRVRWRELARSIWWRGRVPWARISRS